MHSKQLYRADLKKCWLAMLLPTLPKQALPPKKILPFWESFFFSDSVSIYPS